MAHHHEENFKLNTPEFADLNRKLDRRNFLSKTAFGLGAMALNSLLGSTNAFGNTPSVLGDIQRLVPKAKRVVYLFMAGGPAQFETFDYKPKLQNMFGQGLPDSVRQGQRLTGMSANQAILPIAPSAYSFKQYGKNKTWVSDLLPHTAQVVDDLCILKSVFTEQINHDPAITFFQTGHQLPGRPSIGSWLSYGLGSENQNLPAFIVLVSKNAPKDQPLYARLWGNGFLPSEYQGVQFRAGKDPVLFLNNPEGYDGTDRKQMLDYLSKLNQVQNEAWGDPEVAARMAQYEMAFRMQTSVPEVMDTSNEPDEVFELYGKDSRDKGSYAANCLLARKLLERDVRFVQLYHQGWDHHGGLPKGMAHQCEQIDRATAALIIDLKRRGLLEDTLVGISSATAISWRFKTTASRFSAGRSKPRWKSLKRPVCRWWRRATRTT